MKNSFSFKVNLNWIPVIDKERYPLKGVYHVFIQNFFELLFSIGFVWYFSWPPLFVLCCCVVEVCAICFFSILKIKSSIGLMDKWKYKLACVFSFVCLTLSALQFVIFFKINSQYNIYTEIDLLWNNNEFLFCVFALVLQQYVEYFKYKKTILFFPVEFEYVFVNPVIKLLVQQVIVLLFLGLLMTFSGASLFVQTLFLTVSWFSTKLLLGQMQVVILPVTR